MDRFQAREREYDRAFERFAGLPTFAEPAQLAAEASLRSDARVNGAERHRIRRAARLANVTRRRAER